MFIKDKGMSRDLRESQGKRGTFVIFSEISSCRKGWQTLGFLVGLVGLGVWSVAQEEGPPGARSAPGAIQHVKSITRGPEPEQAPLPQAPQALPAPLEEAAPPDPDQATVERLKRIQAQTELIAPKGYSYQAGDRRDPFLSPSEVPSAEIHTGGEQQVGIAAMRIQELEVVGLIQYPDITKRVMVMGSDARGYWLKEGDRLRDGNVLFIDLENQEVIFRQDITDPLAIKPYREVVRQLYPTQEESTR
jgi:hypothetical protein